MINAIGLCIECEVAPIENKETGLCAGCGQAMRKAERVASKEKKIYRITKVSPKLAKELKKYSGQGGTREQHLKEHPNCQLKLQGCEGVATQVHHSAKRGKNLNNVKTFLSACQNCHDFVEFQMSAKERRERGFLK